MKTMKYAVCCHLWKRDVLEESGRRGDAKNKMLLSNETQDILTIFNIYAFCGVFLFSVDVSIKHIYCAIKMDQLYPFGGL